MGIAINEWIVSYVYHEAKKNRESRTQAQAVAKTVRDVCFLRAPILRGSVCSVFKPGYSTRCRFEA